MAKDFATAEEEAHDMRMALGDALSWFNKENPDINPMDKPGWVITAIELLVK